MNPLQEDDLSSNETTARPRAFINVLRTRKLLIANIR
jgi:hypothetical protein